MRQEEWYTKLEAGKLHNLDEDQVMDSILSDWKEDRAALQEKIKEHEVFLKLLNLDLAFERLMNAPPSP